MSVEAVLEKYYIKRIIDRFNVSFRVNIMKILKSSPMNCSVSFMGEYSV